MKHTIEVKDGANKITIIKVELSDDCKNGFDDFSLRADIFTRQRNTDTKINRGGKVFYFQEILPQDEIIKLVPELEIFAFLNGRDLGGFDSYPIMNTQSFLRRENFEYGCKLIHVDLEKGKELAKYSEFHFGEFLKEHSKDVLIPKVKEGVLKLEELTGETYVPATDISLQLFNDLHYCLVTKDLGWNVTKGIQDKKTLTYSDVNNKEKILAGNPKK